MTPDTDAIARRLRAELPAQIAALPKDRRGYPITFVTAIGDDGTPTSPNSTDLGGPRPSSNSSAGSAARRFP